MVDSLIAPAAFMECLTPEERLHGRMVKSMDSGPRLHGFKARLCYLTIWVSYPALGKLLSLSTSISSSVVKVRIVSTSQGYSEH